MDEMYDTGGYPPDDDQFQQFPTDDEAADLANDLTFDDAPIGMYVCFCVYVTS